MICIISLIVAGILGIFSAKYRRIAKEALDCVLRRVTFRKCDTGLNQRLKGEITGKFLKINPKLGRFMYKYFEWFSWILLILMLATLFFVGQGIYFYAKYGNCNGPNSNQFCIFDPLGTNKPANATAASSGEEICAVPNAPVNQELIAPSIGNLTHEFYTGNPDASVVIIEFGCFSCHYTKEAEPTVQKLIDHYGNKILYIYRDFPLTLLHENALIAAEAAHCAYDQGKYEDYRAYLFANQPKQYEEDLIAYAEDLDMNITQFRECLDSEKYKALVEENYQEGLDAGVTVTPTFFINNETIVGAQPYSKFKKVIDDELGLNFWQRLFG